MRPAPRSNRAESMTDEPTLPQGPGTTLTFLYYFSGTALVTTLLAVKVLGVGLDTGIPNQFGVLLGAVGGSLGTYFYRSKIMNIPVAQPKAFWRQVNEVLAEMGYTEDPEAAWEGIRVYRRSPLRQAFSGKIYVQVVGKQAYISSRAMYLRKLKRKLL